MADIISNDSTLRGQRGAQPATNDGTAVATRRPAANDSAALLPLVEMLFFAYRDFTGEADAALETYGLGRAHHRVIHFVNRRAGIRVADLLDLLKITKQSLGRVLRKLVDDGWIEQVPGPDDRRERRLTLTDRGRILAAELAALQTRRIEAALSEIDGMGDGEPREHVRNFLFAMIARNARASVADIVGGVSGDTETAPHVAGAPKPEA